MATKYLCYVFVVQPVQVSFPIIKMNLPTHCPHTPVSLITKNHPRSHNLNIHSYNFDEILNIFGLGYDISLDDLRQAKKRVLMIHPDKSNLPADYFLFYKQAYESVLRYYETKTKHDDAKSQIMPEPGAAPKYRIDEDANPQVRTMVGSIEGKKFQSQFNRLFEENMVQPSAQKNRNAWFSEDRPELAVPNGNVSASNLASTFESMKHDPRNQQMLARYTGVQELRASGGMGTQFYEGDDEDDETATQYVCSDPFSKLKFDDLRKVHKDQTIFSVSESDLSKQQTYANVEQYNRARSSQEAAPMEKAQAERLLRQQQAAYEERMAKRQHADQMRTMTFEEKNKQVMSYFLQLENGGAR